MTMATPPTISVETTRNEYPTDPRKVQPGTMLLVQYWTKVKNVFAKGDSIKVLGLDEGIESFGVDGFDLVKQCLSADLFEEEIEVSATKLVEIFLTCYNVPFTVVFTKKDGTERTLRGRMVAPEPLFGRSKVEDMDIELSDKAGRLREVDHRTLKSLTVKGVKYSVSKSSIRNRTPKETKING